MSKLHIAPASRRNSHHYDASHTYTSDFGMFSVPRQIEVNPGDNFTGINMSMFCRFDALAKPTFGRIYNRTLASWTPHHILKQDADAYHAGDRYFNGAQVSIPKVSMGGFHNLFVWNKLGYTTTQANEGPFCSKLFNGANKQERYFKPIGKYVYKLLTQLGYDIINADNYEALPDALNDTYSAFPLMAFFKSYQDLLSNAQTQNRSMFSRILNMWYQGSTDVVSLGVDYEGSHPVATLLTDDEGRIIYELDPYVIGYLFSQVRIMWQDDLYTEAWRYPTSPIGVEQQSFRDMKLQVVTTDPQPSFDNTNEYGPTGTDPYGTPTIQPQIWLDILKRFDSYVRRNNYAGSLVTQQLLARYGVNIGDVKHLYAQRVYSNSDVIMIGDVTATAGTEENALGSYAGKAVGTSDNHFNFSADDYGELTFFQWFTPEVQYRGGMEPSVLRNDFTDFYVPELDGMQANPISFREICDYRVTPVSSLTSKYNMVFGWNERYNNYRKMRSKVTGDIVLYGGDTENWVLMRHIDTSKLIRGGEDKFAQSDYMIYQPVIGHPCLNIFNVLNNDSDHIKVYSSIEMNANRLLMSFTEATGIPEGGTTIEKNGTHNN